MEEVSAATKTERKKRMEINAPTHGAICEKMNGSVSNNRPGPSPGWSPAANTAGITAKPASKANSKSKIAVPPAETIRFSFFET